MRKKSAHRMFYVHETHRIFDARIYELMVSPLSGAEG